MEQSSPASACQIIRTFRGGAGHVVLPPAVNAFKCLVQVIHLSVGKNVTWGQVTRLPTIYLRLDSTAQGCHWMLNAMQSQECSMRSVCPKRMVTTHLTKLFHHMSLKGNDCSRVNPCGLNPINRNWKNAGIPKSLLLLQGQVVTLFEPRVQLFEAVMTRGQSVASSVSKHVCS